MTRFFVLLIAACSAHEASPPAVPTAPALAVEWNMRVEGDQLRIDYTIKNATSARLTVVDALLVHRQFNYDAIVVRGDTTPDAIAFTRGFVPPESGSKPEFIPTPHYRDIPAGGELRGSAHTQVPLGASRNYSSAYAIYGTRPHAVLEIEYYDDPDVDASNAHQASWRTHPRKLLRSAVKPLPSGATLASPEQQAARSYGNVLLGCPSPCPEPQAPSTTP